MTLSRQYTLSGSYARSRLMWELTHPHTHTHTLVHKDNVFYPQGVFFLPPQERSSVLRCPVDPVGTPLRLMASGFLTSHLRNMSHLDSPCGSGTHGHGSGTGPGFVIPCLLLFNIYFTKESVLMWNEMFWTFLVKNIKRTYFYFLYYFLLHLHTVKQAIKSIAKRH